MFQDEGPIFTKVRVTIIVREKVYMNMCRILSGYRKRLLWIYKCKSILSVIKEKVINILFYFKVLI